MSPYKEAFAWIDRYPGTGASISLGETSAVALARRVCGISFRECLHDLDEDQTAPALR